MPTRDELTETLHAVDGDGDWFMGAAAASPIDDVRGTAAYRRHALAVLAQRTLTWAWRDLCG